jgi:hypothetical protein
MGGSKRDSIFEVFWGRQAQVCCDTVPEKRAPSSSVFRDDRHCINRLNALSYHSHEYLSTGDFLPQSLVGAVAGTRSVAGSLVSIPRARELLTNIPEPLNSVGVAHTFPNLAQASQIVVGEKVTTVLSIRNELPSTLNVSYITGSINSARSYSIFLHNFTTYPSNTVVPAGHEKSIEYNFATPQNMPPRQFRLALTVFYSEMGSPKMHAQTFFNSTIEVMEPERLIDTEALLLYATLLGIAAALGATLDSILQSHFRSS